MDMLTQHKPPLLAGQYRQLWLDSADELGLVAEILSEALGWQPTPDAPLPDAVELAREAAERLIAHDAQAIYALIKQASRQSNLKRLTITTDRA